MILCRLIKYRFTNNIRNFSNLADLSPKERLVRCKEMAPKYRKDPVIKVLNTTEFTSIFTEELNSLSSIFKQYGYEIRIAGGAVRDLLLGKQPKDLDFATTATPDQMKTMFTEENIRMINMNGEKHGTITPRINDKENFEVTTLRIDVVTDGRHAEVQYTTDWFLDANRRDLTINSMFLGFDGTVYDYFYGFDDLQNKRIAFVGEASQRIQEDYLRILRYFRFYGRIAEESNKHEEETLKAIRDNVDGLERISGERIWVELKKILEGNFAGEIMTKIIECNIGPYIGLPKDCNTEDLLNVWKHLQGVDTNAITLLSSLINSDEEAMVLHGRLKFSAFERDLLLFLVQNRSPKLEEKPLKPYQRLVLLSKNNKTKLWVIELLKYLNSEHIKEFEDWDVPRFPVNGSMLKEKGIANGKEMGYVLNKLKDHWIEKDTCLSAEEILKELPHILDLTTHLVNHFSV
ncbi:PREDICTED: CCA tRNA nucleotidyltransferase 1, mitochondrial isoform X2 [Nicrophorus vespilloides]|uniref:CCA tRNA nucleotidyltransferase 1, mitochondrial isoform X2 n=1 Tax=Nicrophorus vespilloides TaxID=110193 RepID=A0ABM1NEH9_NICVS|nr:PREDICTED: CCA tRNA nucleotidyltransferase 1, mitochondrial isoform X2 [Nicrophorus vespilloides]